MLHHNNNRLIWIDLEMTGLNPIEDKILEIATLVTDDNLNIIAEGPNFVIHQSDEVLENMNEWCKVQHAKSGLIEAVKNSTISQDQAELETLQFLQQHCDENSTPLCGNSVWQDKIFINQHMPKLGKFFHYRIVDVSSIKLVINRWTKKYKMFKKSDCHRAMDDIKESIGELKFYKETFFKLSEEKKEA
ncbi:oligoribonuclease [Candidatus Babeliales bacterium]|nr:oligoribonuclease [Candidatus Babeliales bacterium]MBP9843402.1 oligoribonuclease [Candidatus Babeliales bacterium]